MAESSMQVKKRIIRQGPLQKKSSVLKQWRSKFVVLNREMMVIFKKEEDEKRGRTYEERIFVMDINSIEKYDSKKKDYCFCLTAEDRTYTFCCSSELQREMWMRAIQTAKDNEMKEEETDPLRRKSTKLTGGLKRLTIQRKIGQGLGCTIKNVGGIIFVNRILDEGPVSTNGILRPGDQLLDINGIEVNGRSVSEISEIIKASPEIVLCTVKPATDFRYIDTHETTHTEYAELDLSAMRARNDSSGTSSNASTENDAPTDKKESQSCSDVISEEQKRHSLPARVSSESSTGGKTDATPGMHYLELDFPCSERPRGRSEVLKPSPREQRRQKEAAYAYIELEFGQKMDERPVSPRSAHKGSAV